VSDASAIRFPDSWRLASLEDLVWAPKSDIVDGPFGSNLKASEYVEHGIPIIRLQNIDRNMFVLKNIRYVTEQKARDLSRHGFIRGDIVISKLGDPLGEACVVPNNLESGIIVADVVRVRLPEGAFNKLAIVYALNSQAVQSQFRLLTKGTTRPRINLNHVRSVGLPIPPRAEQDRLVAEIEKQFTRLDAAVAALKRVQANLKRYRAAVLKAACEGRLVPAEAELARKEGRSYETGEQLLARILKERRAKWEADQIAKMIASGEPPKNDDWKRKYKEPEPPEARNLPPLPEGWTWASLAQISEIQGGIQKQPKRTPRSNAFPYLRVANVYRGRLDLSEIEDMELFCDELEKLRLQTGDLLIVEGNGSPGEIGRMAIWRGEIENCVHQNHIIRARLLGEIAPSFCASYWNSPRGAGEVLRLAGSTSGLYTLSVSKVGRLPIPLAPLDEQIRIVTELERRLSQLAATEIAGEHNFVRTDRLRQSMLKCAFEGKLVPQDPNDEPASVLLERIRAERNIPVEATRRARTSGRGKKAAITGTK
jgi:type I restriction enzyme, S subunit